MHTEKQFAIFRINKQLDIKSFAVSPANKHEFDSLELLS